MKIRNVLSSLLLGAVISMPVYVYADSKDDAIVKLVSDFADKPEQHQALANYYKEKSADAKKDLEVHRSMKKGFTSNSKFTGAYGNMQSMCDELIKSDEAAIKAYDTMAAEHTASVKK